MIGGSSAWRVEGAGLVGTGAPSYKGFRFPVEVISHCVWLYYRFPLSLREVEEMMLARGVTVSHETTSTQRNKLTGLRPSPTRRAVAGLGGWAPVGGI
jgi:hypothetical protein